MRVVLVRHAAAVERGTPGLRDDLRPLTDDGAAKFREATPALAGLAAPDEILASPMLRAKQTAEILASACPASGLREEAAIAGPARGDVERALAATGAETVAVVGHEPALGRWLGEWLGSDAPAAFEFKKGGAALVEFDGRPQGGAGRLLWFLPPKVLRRIATG